MAGRGFWVEVDDNGHVRALMIDFADAATGAKDRVADVMQSTGPTFVTTMKRVVRKDTHTLEKSLHFRVNRRYPLLRLGSLKRNKNPKSGQLAQTYAGYVHDGTWRMDPNPFVDIAVNRHTTEQGRFMRGLRKAGIANIGRSTGGVNI